MGGCIGNREKGEFITPEEQEFKLKYPLHYICVGNKMNELETILMKSTTDVNVKDDRGFTPLVLSIMNENWYIVSLLLNAKRIDLTVQDSLGNTCLHHSSKACPSDLVYQICTQQPSLVDGSNRKKETPLAVAARTHNLDVIKVLLKCNADVNGSSRKKGAPLMNCIKKSWVEGAKFFISHPDIDLNCRPGPNGEGFLWCRHNDILDLLLSHGSIDVGLTDNNGITADQWLQSQNLTIAAQK
eukprot:UN33063